MECQRQLLMLLDEKPPSARHSASASGLRGAPRAVSVIYGPQCTCSVPKRGCFDGWHWRLRCRAATRRCCGSAPPASAAAVAAEPTLHFAVLLVCASASAAASASDTLLHVPQLSSIPQPSRLSMHSCFLEAYMGDAITP